jgi:hypothetical protein
MKTIRILQAAVLLMILALAASCRSSRDIPDRQYPDSRRNPDYPDYLVYRGSNPRNLPPGQAKKVYGGRSAKPYAPGQRKKYGYSYRRYPLIIIRTPDIIIGRYHDGRYYYRNPDGLIYWRGYDDRYYLGDEYLDRARYNDDEYREWKYKSKKHNDDDWKKEKHNGKSH